MTKLRFISRKIHLLKSDKFEQLFAKNTLLPGIVWAYSLKCYCKYTIESALIDILSNVDNTFLKPVLHQYFTTTPQNPHQIHPSVLRAYHLESIFGRKFRKFVLSASDSKLSKYIKIFKKFNNIIPNAQ